MGISFTRPGLFTSGVVFLLFSPYFLSTFLLSFSFPSDGLVYQIEVWCPLRPIAISLPFLHLLISSFFLSGVVHQGLVILPYTFEDQSLPLLLVNYPVSSPLLSLLLSREVLVDSGVSRRCPIFLRQFLDPIWRQVPRARARKARAGRGTHVVVPLGG